METDLTDIVRWFITVIFIFSIIFLPLIYLDNRKKNKLLKTLVEQGYRREKKEKEAEDKFSSKEELENARKLINNLKDELDKKS